MAQPDLSNPILNSPYDPPESHFELGPNGPTGKILSGRRPSESFIPVPPPKKGQKDQQVLDFDVTGERREQNTLINDIRREVERWRANNWNGVTPYSRKLLSHWAAEPPTRDDPVFFCQREAAETAIFLAEIAGRHGTVDYRRRLEPENELHNDGLPRIGLKMATGSGKTVVMAMVIAWQTINKVFAPRDARFAKQFLVVTPGITIRDRLGVLHPEREESYYRERDLVPADLWDALLQAQVPGGLTPGIAGRFLEVRCEGASSLRSWRALDPLVGYLRRLGVVPKLAASADSPVDRLLAEYRDYLVRERGLTSGSVAHWERVAKLFLTERSEPLDDALRRLSTSEVTGFVIAQCGPGGRSGASAKILTSGLRSLLRFLHLTPSATRGHEDYFAYETRFAGLPGIRSAVRLEPGVQSATFPTEVAPITSLVAQFLQEQGSSDMADNLEGFEMTLLHYRRTFVEKMFALHGKVLRLQQDGVALGRDARHYPDLWALPGSTRFGRCSPRPSTARFARTTTRRAESSSPRAIARPRACRSLTAPRCSPTAPSSRSRRPPSRGTFMLVPSAPSPR